MNHNKQYHAERANLPDWFEYPAGFRSLVKQGIVDFKPWYLVDVVFALKTYQMFRTKYKRELFPIAHRHGSDVVACIEKNRGDTVQIINGYTSSGHENEGKFNSFWEWFRCAIDEMIDLNQSNSRI